MLSNVWYHNFQRYYHSKGVPMLKRQLYIVYIVSIFIPILLIGSYLVYNNYSMLYDHHESMLVSDNLRVRSIVFETTTSITNICDAIAENKELMTLLQANYPSQDDAINALEASEVISSHYSRHTDIASITLYTENPTLTSYEHIVAIDEHNREWFNEKTRSVGYFWSVDHVTNNFGVEHDELQLTHKINVPGSSYNALLTINVSNNYLKNRVVNNDLDVDITTNDSPVFFSSWGQTGKIPDVLNYQKDDFFSYSGITNYFGHKLLMEVSTYQPIKSNDRIYLFSTDPQALNAIRHLVLNAGLIVLISLLIPLILIIKYTKQLITRVDTLRREMHRVTGGDYNIIETFKGNDELAELFSDLKIMITSINERDQAIFDGQIKHQQLINHQQKMEMEILSSKINPHFLYNTLETIRMKAFSVDDLDVANAIKLLGRYMRYNLESTGEQTTLQEELNYIEIYLKIQKLRFTSRINYKIIIDDNIHLSQIKIMPLLIQPIVENAILHGHEETLEDGLIEIKVLDYNTNVLIQVIDNGSGMDEDTLNRLKTTLTSDIRPLKSSFGLYNIQKRIQLSYGDDHGLDIKSSLGQGSLIQFMVPKS